MNEQIKEIIANFDFERVHEAMVALKWTWYNSKSEDKVPSTSELVMEATELLERVYNSDHNPSFIEMGGFKAYKDEYTKLGLIFQLASWEIDAEDYND